MERIALSLLALAMVAGVAARSQPSTRTDVDAAPQSAKEVRGASPYAELEHEPAPKLIVDPPLPNLLDRGVVWIQWRAENIHIVPVFGKGALNVSPRAGHCTSMSTTCRGGGRTRVTSIRSTWLECRPAPTRSGSTW